MSFHFKPGTHQTGVLDGEEAASHRAMRAEIETWWPWLKGMAVVVAGLGILAMSASAVSKLKDFILLPGAIQ